MRIEFVPEALRQGQLGEGYRELRELWRKTRDNELARLLDALEVRIVGTDDVMAEELAQRAELVRKLRGTWEEILRILPAMTRYVPDPVLGTQVFERLAQQTRNPDIALWRTLREFWKRHMDPRRLVGLRMLRDTGSERFASATVAKQWDTFVTETLVQTEKTIKERREMKEVEREVVEEVREFLGLSPVFRPQNTADVAALWQEVYDHPQDDEPRLVLADYLLEIGDIRGEFIQAQMVCAQPEVPMGYRSRTRRLQLDWERVWLGRLEPVLVRNGNTWERGFLVGGQLRQPKDATVWTQLRDAPEWRTFRRLTGWMPGQVLLSPALESLEELHEISVDMLLALANAVPRKLKKVGLNWQSATDGVAVLKKVKGSGLSEVEELTVEGLGSHSPLPILEKLLPLFPGIRVLNVLEFGSGIALLAGLLSKKVSFNTLKLWFSDHKFFFSKSPQGKIHLEVVGTYNNWNVRRIEDDLRDIKKPIADTITLSGNMTQAFKKFIRTLGGTEVPGSPPG